MKVTVPKLPRLSFLKPRFFQFHAEPGAMPGTVKHAADAVETKAYLIATTVEQIHEREIHAADELEGLEHDWPMRWVNVEGLANEQMLIELGEEFNLHPLALEDATNTEHRPKTEIYDTSLFIVLRMVAEREGGIDSEQISIFLGKSFVLTLQEKPGDCLEPVRNRMRRAEPRIRMSRPAYVAYAIVDAIIDHYFPVLERLGDRIEDLEDQVAQRTTSSLLDEIYTVRRELLKLRRYVWPMREAVDQMYRSTSEFIDEDTRVYLRDCYDHCVQLLDLVESYREISAALMESYRSQVSLEMNEVMKVLTIIATLFIPATFIAGIYGMNFDQGASPWNMPELGWRFGYVFAWLLMLGTAGGFLIYFRRKGWIGKGKKK